MLDDTVYSAPVIQERISGGEAQITGSFTPEEASDLAIVLRAGSLPAPVKIIQNVTVGPSLGRDSIEKGIRAAIIGAILVVGFMLVYYRFAGLVADIALVFNILYLLAGMSLLRATLTLPGIAGIVITSYSIHYTKLYEVNSQRSLLPGIQPPAPHQCTG